MYENYSVAIQKKCLKQILVNNVYIKKKAFLRIIYRIRICMISIFKICKMINIPYYPAKRLLRPDFIFF